MSSTIVSTDLATGILPPPPRQTVLGRAVAHVLRAGLVPVLLIGVPLWPVLLLLSATPLVAFTLPLVLLDTALVAYGLAWLAYLVAGQHYTPTPSGDGLFLSLLRSTTDSLPNLPFNPIKVLRVDAAAMAYVVQILKAFFPAIFDWSYRRVMVFLTQSSAEVVRENVPYTESQTIDIYLPPPYADPAPIMVVLPTLLPPLTLLSMKRTYMQLALQFRREGLTVIVPNIRYYPDGTVEQSVADLRALLAYIHTHQNLGDPSRIFLLGHGLSAHLALLTVVQHAVVHSREKVLDQAWERDHGLSQAPTEPDSEDELTEHDHALQAQILKAQQQVQAALSRGASSPLPTAGSSPTEEETSAFSTSPGDTDLNLPDAEERTAALSGVKIYAPEAHIAPVRGVVCLAGISDLIRMYRFERERGMDDLSVLRPACGPEATKMLVHSPAHLLDAAQGVLDPNLLPPNFLLIHGGADAVVPLDQSVLLSHLLTKVGVHCRLRAYKALDHTQSLAAAFLGMRTGLTAFRQPILQEIMSFVRE